MKKRPIRLQAELNQDPPMINPINYVTMDAGMQKSIHKLLHPKPEETAAALKKLISRKNWSHQDAANFLNVNPRRIQLTLEGKITDGAIVRLVWLASKLDEEPDFLHNPLYWTTWGKSKGLTPRPERIPASARPPKKKKFIMPRVLLPNSPWVYVDWSQTNADIAELVKVSPLTVATNRRMFKKLPRSVLLKAFSAVGRMRQVNIIIRGVDRSLDSLTKRKMAEKMGAAYT